jgi:hypothetical protein
MGNMLPNLSAKNPEKNLGTQNKKEESLQLILVISYFFIIKICCRVRAPAEGYTLDREKVCPSS